MPKEELDKIPVTSLRGIGVHIAEKLSKIHIYTAQDLLFHLPLRYEDRTTLRSIASLHHGGEALVRGIIEKTEIRFGRRRSLLIHIHDGSGMLVLRMFHFSKAQQQSFITGENIQCFGEVRFGPTSVEMIHPEYRFIEQESELPELPDRLTPVYPTTEGLHQNSLRKYTEGALSLLTQYQSKELLPHELTQNFDIKDLNDCLLYVHRPPADANTGLLINGTHPAQQRLAFEELLAHHLSLRSQRKNASHIKSQVLNSHSKLEKVFLDNLAFKPTQAQLRVNEEINADIIKPEPMQRLLQGDVGCGKTVVAALSALKAISAGFKTALMAPTELLAEQHQQSFSNWFIPLGIDVIWVSGKLSVGERKKVHQKLVSETPLMVIGTHALFQETVQFKKLGLVIIDEQHRFGVHQRMALRDKGDQNGLLPHQLIMTATPIPRTLAMTAYADLDTSIIDELPPGRQTVSTVALPEERRSEIIERIQQSCQQGKQAYWVCTLIDESELLQASAASDTAEQLAQALPDIKIGLTHGRMKTAERNQVMQNFKQGDIQLLVATTVIEVGVDVPNASLMIIENAERLGLSQLHQLRGRVGRGNQKSACVLLYKSPLSAHSRERLDVMRKTSDGFEIAQKDLELRGPGQFLGTRQTGLATFKIADLNRDQHLFKAIENAAEILFSKNPGIIPALIHRWIGDALHYKDI